jgi:hypothetical protein
MSRNQKKCLRAASAASYAAQPAGQAKIVLMVQVEAKGKVLAQSVATAQALQGGLILAGFTFPNPSHSYLC